MMLTESLTEALARFDALPAVTTQEMLGEWRGSGVPTGHGTDGLLETDAWYGKSFVSEEVVHPLLFRNGVGETCAIDPRRIPLSLSRFRGLTRNAGAQALFTLATPLLRTRAPRARLRAMLGLMDMRGAAPFFFQLER